MERGRTTSLCLAAGLLVAVAGCQSKSRAEVQAMERSTSLAPVTAEPAGGSTGEPASRGASSNGATPANAAAPWTMPTVPPAVAEGIRVYRANYCGTCHRNTLAGTAGIFGPNHDSLRANAARRIHDTRYTGHATTPEAYVRESIRDPGAYRAPGFERSHFLMPAYTQLSDAQVDALVRMLLWQPSPQGGP